MADKKISELDAITGAATAADDFFIVVDSSGSATKKISREELNNAIERDVLSTVDIDGGTIDGTTIGGSSAAAGTFTDLTVTGTVTGISTGISNVVEDTTPQLGGDLDTNGNDITGTGNINNTGTITTDGLTVDGNIALNGITTFTDSNVRLDLMESDTTDVNSRLQSSSGSMLFRTINDSKSSATTRMEINNSTGDISFYDSTGVSQNFFWDSSASRLTLSSSDYHFGIQQGGNQAWYLRGVSDGSFRLHLNGTGDIVTATTGGNVGIGVTSTGGGKLAIGGTGTSAAYHYMSNAAGNGYLGISSSTGGAIMVGDSANSLVLGTGTVTPLHFGTNNNVRATIDTSGNVLAGTTVTNPAQQSSVTGISLRTTGAIEAAASAGNAARFNRLSSDGSIVNFRKDGATVGSIGSRGTGTSYIILKSSSGAGAGLTGSDNAILPMDESALADANTDLGGSSYRFKDLHLSNSVLAGATSGRGGASTGHLFKMPSGDIYFEIMGNAAGSNTDILFSDGTGGSYGVVGYDHTNDALRFFANSGEKVRITSGGDVGIGTSSPTAKIQTNTTSAGAATVGLFLNNESDTINTEVRLAFAANANNDIASNRYSYISAINTSGVNGQALSFATNQTGASAVEAMRITSSGDVGIGTDSPSTYLGGTNGLAVSSNFAGIAQRGTTHSQAWLSYVYLSGRYEWYNITSNRTEAYLTTGGAFYNRSGTYGTISDSRLKQDIVDSGSQWDDIKALQVKKYRLNTDVEAEGEDAPVMLGVIAQDLEAAGMNGLVEESLQASTDEDGNIIPSDETYKTVKYSILYMKAVKALQEAMDRIETLEAKVAALEAN